MPLSTTNITWQNRTLQQINGLTFISANHSQHNPLSFSFKFNFIPSSSAEFYGDLVKISIAAVVTLLLVAVCATAELTSKFKVRSRIKRATASVLAHNPDREELLKKAAEEKEVQHAWPRVSWPCTSWTLFELSMMYSLLPHL